MTIRTATHFLLAAALALLACAASGRAGAEVPVRISVKFILDINGNRPATGAVSQDADVQDQVDRANQILAGVGSELRVELVEIVDIANASQFFSASSTSITTRDDIRDAAQSDPTGYAWRTNAVNYYVNGSTSSAISDFPDDNNIVVSGQNISDTTFLHELGHSLSLAHTHETAGSDGGDECNDTITDMSSWSEDDISNNAFNANYTSLSASQRAQVDAVWNNVMSYHDANNRDFLTPCQMDRNSKTAWDDRTWMLTRRPVYVDGSAGAGGNSGSWSNPFATVDEAIGAGSLADRVVVLLSGSHTLAQPLGAANAEMVTRRGPATVTRPDVTVWDGAVDPAGSGDSAVAAAMRAVQTADAAGDPEAALAALREGERLARGADRIAIRLELAQRLRRERQFDAAIRLYEQVAEESGEEKLRKSAEHWANRVKLAKRRHEAEANPGHPRTGSEGASENGR